jgi:hypothetical protein
VIDDDRQGTNLRDGDDTVNAGDEDDAVVADNAVVKRPVQATGLWRTFKSAVGATKQFDLAVRDVSMAQTPEPAGAFGNDYVRGQEANDDVYGQLGDDYVEGNQGEDAVVSDLGKITNNLLGDGVDDAGLTQAVIAPNQPFFDATVYENGSLYRVAQLYAATAGAGVGAGSDTVLGGDGEDSVHLGPGADLANGNTGEDHLFGGDGPDAMWGGPDHDEVFGGYGDDWMDIEPRPARVDKKQTFPEDPPEWYTYANIQNYQGLDLIYGGWDQDAMQADEGRPGPHPGDRLIDWVGGYNAYYVCPGAYGERVITRSHSPSMIAFLQQLAQGNGAHLTADAAASGFREVGIVFPNEARLNSNPTHPDHPAHFTCSTQVPEPDLTVAPGDIDLSIVAPAIGDSVTLTATVHNIGSVVANDAAVRFLVDGVQVGADQTVAAVAVEGTGTASVVWDTTGLPAGAHTVTVEVDPVNTIAESNEANNAASKPVTLGTGPVTPPPPPPGTNLAPNGSFESSADGYAPDGWTATGTTSYAAGGSQGGRSVTTDAADGLWSSAGIPLAAGDYTVAVDVHGVGGTLTVVLLDAASSIVGTAPLSLAATSGDGFTTYDATFTVPAGVSSVRITLAGLADGETIFDDVRLQAVE